MSYRSNFFLLVARYRESRTRRSRGPGYSLNPWRAALRLAGGISQLILRYAPSSSRACLSTQQVPITTVQRLVDRTRGGCGADSRLHTSTSQAQIGVIDAVRGRDGLARTVNVQAPADRPSCFGRQTRIGLGGWSCPLLAESQSMNCVIVVDKVRMSRVARRVTFSVKTSDPTQRR